MQAVRVAARFQRRHRDRQFVEALASYLLALRAENRSPRTVAFNRTRLERLGRETHLATPSSITPGMVRSALLSVKSTGVSDRYVEQHRASWSAFFRFEVADGELASSPMANIGPWAVDEREAAHLSLAELRRLLAAPGRGFFGDRGRAALALFFDTGIRPGELVAVEVGHVDEIDRTLLVPAGKSRRERRVPLSDRALELVTTYRDRWRPAELLPSRSRSLFVDRTAHRRPLSEGAVSQWLTDLSRGAGIRHVTPYMARHTFATLFLLGGGSELELRRILGHKDLRMIDQHYAHLVTDDLKRAHAIASPLAQLGAG